MLSSKSSIIIERLMVCLLVLMMAAITSHAQTQQGYVKTKGRMDDSNKVIPGSRLSGATIVIRGGNAVVSGSDGSFSLMLPQNRFFLQDVRKNGYTLTDPDIISKQYVQSANPLIIVLESPTQQADDRLVAERKIRKTLQRLLEQKESEITALKAQNRLTEEQYRTHLQILYSDQKDSEALIGEMVERYSQLDYDQMDDFSRKMSELILNGELTKADSLINTKGNVSAQVAIQRERRVALDKRKEELSKAETIYRQDLQDLAQRCYAKFEIFKLRHQYDSAAFYIDLRADMDSLQDDWQFDAAVFHAKVNHFKKSEAFYRRVISHLAMNDTCDNAPILCVTLNNLGILYNQFHHLNESQVAYIKALEICQQLMVNDSSYETLYAQSLNNLAILKQEQGLMDESEQLFSKVLTIQKKWIVTNPAFYKPLMAQTFNNLANLYLQTQRTSLSESMYLLALTAYKELVDDGYKTFDADKAATLANLGTLNRYIGQNVSAKHYYREALDIFCRLSEDLPKSYENSIDEIVKSLQTMMSEKNESNYMEQMELYRFLSEAFLDRYTPFLAQILNTLADFYDNGNMLQRSEPLYMESLEVYQKLALKDSIHYTPYVARELGNISYHFLLVKDYAKAERYARDALTTDCNKFFVYANLAHSLLFQGREAEAEAIYNKYKNKLRKTFLDDFQKFKDNKIIPDEYINTVERIITQLHQ